MTYDIVTVGSATVDVFLRSDAFAINDRGQESLVLSGGKIEVEEKIMTVGGGGTNTAVGFSRLGLKCACVARFGEDWAGNWIKENLKKEPFDKRFLKQMSKEETDFSTVLLSSTGERIILTFRGKTRIDKETFPFKLLSKTNWLYLASLEGNIELLEEIVSQAQREQVSIALNPGNLELEEKDRLGEVFSKIRILILNEEEARRFWGENYLNEMATAGPKMVVVTCGKAGAYFYENGQTKKESALEGKVIDATGAGDAFSVGLVAGLIWGYSPQKAMQVGMTESLSVIGKIGPKTGLLTRKELEEKLNNGFPLDQ